VGVVARVGHCVHHARLTVDAVGGRLAGRAALAVHPARFAPRTSDRRARALDGKLADAVVACVGAARDTALAHGAVATFDACDVAEREHADQGRVAVAVERAAVRKADGENASCPYSSASLAAWRRPASKRAKGVGDVSSSTRLFEAHPHPDDRVVLPLATMLWRSSRRQAARAARRAGTSTGRIRGFPVRWI
jgi:hypothetical protein